MNHVSACCKAPIVEQAGFSGYRTVAYHCATCKRACRRVKAGPQTAHVAGEGPS